MIGSFYALAWWFGAPFIVFHADPPQLNSATPLAAPVHRSKTPAMHSPGGECMAGLHPFSLGVGAPSEIVFTASAGSSTDPAAVQT